MTRTADNITAIYDAGPDIWDRYTVFIDDCTDEALCLSGVEHNAVFPRQAAYLGYSEFANAEPGDHLGRPITFDELPEHIQRLILHRINYAEMVEAAARNQEGQK